WLRLQHLLGMDTTDARTITGPLSALYTTPDLWRKIRENRSYTPLAWAPTAAEVEGATVLSTAQRPVNLSFLGGPLTISWLNSTHILVGTQACRYHVRDKDGFKILVPLDGALENISFRVADWVSSSPTIRINPGSGPY